MVRYWDGQRWLAESRSSAAQPPAPPPPQPDRSSPRRRGRQPWTVRQSRLVAAGLTVLIVIAVINGLTRQDEDDAEGTTTSPTTLAEPSALPAPAEPALPEADGLGVAHRDGDLEFVVHSWDGQIAALTVTNVGTSPHSFSYQDQDLFDTEGKRFTPSVNVLSDLVLAGLNPGESVSGELRFELSGATAERLELHASMFSDGVVVPPP